MISITKIEMEEIILNKSSVFAQCDAQLRYNKVQTIVFEWRNEHTKNIAESTYATEHRGNKYEQGTFQCNGLSHHALWAKRPMYRGITSPFELPTHGANSNMSLSGTLFLIDLKFYSTVYAIHHMKFI